MSFERTRPAAHADRRSRRAVAPLLAAEYLLDARRGDADALVLLDRGEILAASGPGALDAARLGAELAERGDVDSDADVFAHDVAIGERKMVLASRGARVRSVRAVEAALRRILG